MNGLRVSRGASRCRAGTPSRAGTGKPPGAGGRFDLWGWHATQGDGSGANPPRDRVAGHLPSERSDHPFEPGRQPGHDRRRRRQPEATGTLRAGGDIPPQPSHGADDDAAIRHPHRMGRVDLISRRLGPGNDHREQCDQSANEDDVHQREEQPGAGRRDDPRQHERSDRHAARHRARATKRYAYGGIRGAPSPRPDDARPGTRLELRQRRAGYRAGLRSSILECRVGLDRPACGGRGGRRARLFCGPPGP
jgi:hypothetical protein